MGLSAFKITVIFLVSSAATVAVAVDVDVDVNVSTANDGAIPVPAVPVQSDDRSEGEIPLRFDAPFGSYPNLLNITQDERDSFHPVVLFPKRFLATSSSNNNNNNNNKKINIAVNDHRRSSNELASHEEIVSRRIKREQQEEICTTPSRRRSTSKLLPQRLVGVARRFVATRISLWFQRENNDCPSSSSSSWGIGKYDENRDGGMYESDLFDDLDNTIDGFGGRRVVHLGMDLGGPVGTPVYSFADGIVHSVGYNPELGDYGHVIVLEHSWGGEDGNNKTCWALYGHLDKSALTTSTTIAATETETANTNDNTSSERIKNMLQRTVKPSNWRKKQRKQQQMVATGALLKPGDFVAKGQVIGRMGDIDENVGWIHAHLHFQLSTKAPDQPHDMPGASSVPDRREALKQYPDPRYVVGPMY
eukprot:CAMPEP_0168292428 /NCGR_PEP_ID=MMETSP0142_2-20121227/7108_1 /TAXON_ID=44445 /ORGANISM="Pseudo-nitzschia australis, Strain 10249 10 AB" /LENGTH=418 /DNA_ID=CAMNT_0008240229 /DNA_START=150 /DNA_END=1406 /DNA_ORIENTATION=+